MISGTTVWSWDSDGYFHLTDAQRRAADAFVRAHGVRPDTIMIGNTVSVRADGDGFWFHTWRALRDGDNDTLLRCPCCPSCVQQVEVTTRLACPPPPLPGAFFAPGCGLRLAEVDDAGSEKPHS